MRKILLIFLFLSGAFLVNGQFLAGIQGGLNINDIFLGNRLVKTSFTNTSSYGLMFTYLPEGKKPGVRLSMTKTAFEFTEEGEDYLYKYRNNGFDFHFLTHMYFRFSNTRLYINAGPGMSLFNDPVSISNPQTTLPAWDEERLNKFYLHLTGGGGITQQVGKVYISVFGHFSFTTSNVYRFDDGFSNPLITRIGASIELPIKANDDE